LRLPETSPNFAAANMLLTCGVFNNNKYRSHAAPHRCVNWLYGGANGKANE